MGIVQGLSEFLPISSTAHMTLAARAMGLEDAADPQGWTAFIAVVQLGTLIAVLAYFWRDLARMAVAVIRPRTDPEGARLAWLIALGTVPIAVVGLALRDIIEGPLTKDLRVIAASLVAFGALLFLAERAGRRARGLSTLTWRDALVVGGMQVFSLVPGASRSGTTLTGGLFAGLDREAAARFSFLLSIPAIAASGMLQLPTALEAPQGAGTLLAATLAAAASGYAAIWWLVRFLRTRTTMLFVVYRVALGALVLGLVAANVVAP